MSFKIEGGSKRPADQRRVSPTNRLIAKVERSPFILQAQILEREINYSEQQQEQCQSLNSKDWGQLHTYMN